MTLMAQDVQTHQPHPLPSGPPLFPAPWLTLIEVSFRFRVFLAGLMFVIPFANPTAGQESDDLAKLLDKAALAESREALQHLTRGVVLLREVKIINQEERDKLTVRLAKVLFDKARGAEDVARVMGSKAGKQVVRQVFFRRYLEHWFFEAPVRLWVTLDCAKGEDPAIRAIQPAPRDVP